MPDSTMVFQFVRNMTVEGLGEALLKEAATLGWAVETTFGAYENVVPEILAAAEKKPDYLVVTLDGDFFAGDIYGPNWTAERAYAELESILAALERVAAETFVFVATFVPPFQMPLPMVTGKATKFFEWNRRIRDWVAERSHRAAVLDFERVAARLGEAATLDRRFGLMMKAPLKAGFLEEAAKEMMRVLRCRHLPPKKVLVLDCDNTLWGGVVGEVGVEGIALDPYEYPGIAFYRFQAEVRALVEQGVLICLCSKNDEAAVWEVLEKHPHSLLKQEHLAGWQINWTDKATNLAELAKDLSLGLDAMVFVDDNPVECEQVRTVLPEVTVWQVPSKVYQLPGSLQAQEWFDRLTLNTEDKERTQYYQAEQGRREVAKQHIDPESFLRDLGMRAVVRPLQESEIARAAQLCQRTNQFNLTTRRYTESDLAAMLREDEVRIYTLQAADRFGPVGFSGLIIYRKLEETVSVDTFLLSCRIIGRQFDRALFVESARQLLAEWQVAEWQAEYVPTAKNKVVANWWSDYGFSSAPELGEGRYRCSHEALSLELPGVIQMTETL